MAAINKGLQFPYLTAPNLPGWRSLGTNDCKKLSSIIELTFQSLSNKDSHVNKRTETQKSLIINKKKNKIRDFRQVMETVSL